MKNSPQITPAQIEDLRTGNGKPLSDYAPPVELEKIREAHIDFLINNKIPESEFSTEFCQYIKNVREIFPDFPPEDFLKESDLINTALALRGGIVPALFEKPDYILYLTSLEPAQIAALSPHKNGKERAETGQESPISQGGGEYIPKVKFKTLREIQQTDLPPVKWIVKDLLPEGYAILASRPKMGKSWMALQLALAVANGYRALGKFETVKGSVLILDIDQASQRAIKSRLDQQLLQFPDDERFAPENVFWANSINRLEDGGEYELRAQIEKYQPSLVIIDTLRKFAPVDQRNQGYQGEYDLGSKVHEIALQYGICILCVHHTTKATFQYVADEISGTSGVTASADTLLSIRQTLNGVELYAVGREVYQENYIVRFDKQTGLWNVVGNAAEFVGGNSLAEQLAQLVYTVAQGEYDLSIGDYAAILGKKRNYVDKELSKLREKGLLITAERGKHVLNPGVTVAEEITQSWKSKIEKYLS